VKVLASLFGLLASIVLGTATYAQTSISTPFGFHTQTIQHVGPNGKQGHFTLVGSPAFTKGSSTIEDIFGISNQFGLAQGDFTEADKIWIHDPETDYWSQIYYQTPQWPFFTEGWKQIGQGDLDASTVKIPQNASIFLQSGVGVSDRPASHSVAFAYLLNIPPCTNYEAKPGTFNFFSRSAPVGIPLRDTSLENSPGYTKGDQHNSADVLWLPNGVWNARIYGYSQFFYTDDLPPFFTAGWKQVGKGDEDMGHVLLTQSFVIQTKGPGGNIAICNPFATKVTTAAPGAPPSPEVDVTIDLDLDRFVVSWVSAGRNIRYSIEAWDEWSRQWSRVIVNDPVSSGERIYNWASLEMRSAVGRIACEWIIPDMQ
tara:strand:- start:565 stop:1674 length:1110 start_codon:yes stop_codon:yes gene_type:complete